MASKVVVHFEANGVPHRVEVEPAASQVTGILLMPKQEAERLVKEKLKGQFISGKLPPGLTVLDPDGRDVTAQLQSTGFGPGVCYMVGLQVFCW